MELKVYAIPGPQEALDLRHQLAQSHMHESRHAVVRTPYMGMGHDTH